MVRVRGKAPPPPRPWEGAPEVEYRLHKNRINMARSYDSTIVTIQRLILRESASEPEGTQFVTDEEVDGKFYIHKIPQLPISKNKYFIVVMYPPEDLDPDDIPMDSDKPVKFLFSFYNLYLTGFSYDEIWRIFNDAMIVGISQESRDKYVKELAFPGNYGTIGQNYLKLDIGFGGQCDTYNRIVGIQTKKTTEDQLVRVLCRTVITLPESSRFAFLSEFHLITFHTGNFDIVLDKEVLAGEKYKNFSFHLTKWGTYSTMSKNGRQSFKISVIPTSGIESFSGLLNFISVATNKTYDDENKQLEGEVAKAQNTGDDHTDDKGGIQGQNNDNEDSTEKKKNVQGDGKTWFYQAPVMPYVPHKRQNLNLDNQADVATFAVLEINRKTRVKEISWMLLLQLAMREACKYAEEKLSVKYFVEAGAIAARRLPKEDSRNFVKSTGTTRVAAFADMEGEETFGQSFLGHADEVAEERISDDEIILVNGTKNTSVVSMVLTGANDFIPNEIKLSLHDALCNVKRSMDSNMIAAGGGAVEVAALPVHLENQAAALGSMERMAIAELAESSPKVQDQLALEGPLESPGTARTTLAECTSQNLCGPNVLSANLDANCAWTWYANRAQGDPELQGRYPLGRLLGRLGVIA